MTMADRLAKLEEPYAAVPPARRLAAAVEILEWTVANLTAPIADERCRDLVDRAAAMGRAAVAEGRATIPADRSWIDDIDDLFDTAEEGVFALVMAYRLCFDDLAPEITVRRFVVIVDHCRESMKARDEMLGDDDAHDDSSPRRREIRAHHDVVLERYRG